MEKDVHGLLEKYGLTKRQALLYTLLLKHGASKVGLLQKHTGLHKQTIYNELSELIKEEYVSESTHNGRKVFFANEPEVFIEKQKAKQNLLEYMVPKLHAITGWGEGVSTVHVYEGVKSISAFHQSKIKKMPINSEVCILGAGGKHLLQFENQVKLVSIYDTIRTRRSISQRLLMYENQRNEYPEYTEKRFKTGVRYIQSPLKNTMATQIWFDAIALFIFTDTPKLIEIQSKQAVQTYTNYFDLLWKHATD